ncbi:MAG: S1/P1 nuclease [Acidobacteriota bacterium]
MKKSVSLMIIALMLLAPACPAFAWGSKGHQTVGKIASLRIKPQTSQKIGQILEPFETLASISTWADTVKERMGETDSDADTNAFLQDMVHNEKNREWHYDDLPLDCRSYQTCAGFTLENDVVNMLNVCIRTLQGRPAPNHPLSKRNALRLLVHLVGDMHQPLHMGAGFIDENGPNGTILLERDPRTIKRKNLQHDRGGNQLIIDNNRKRLHSFWDSDLVTSLMLAVNKQTSDELGLFLQQTVRPKSNWSPRGRLDTWAAQWATDSLQQSRDNTYRGVRIVRKRIVAVTQDDQPVMANGQPVTEVVYDITRPANYETLNREVVRQQLAKAGFRLARLLDAIFS